MRAAALLSAVLLVSACHMGRNAESREVAQRAFPVGPFDRIALAGSTDVVVTVGGAVSVRAEGDSAILDRLEILVEDGQLRIDMREGSSRWFSFGHDRGATVHVTMPALAGAAIGG
jgi:hypothetical protein